MDGTLGSQTAWMLDGSGVQITSGEELAEIVRARRRGGLPGRRARDRRPREPRGARRVRGDARASGSRSGCASGSSTRSCSRRRTCRASRSSASPRRCSSRTRRPTAISPTASGRARPTAPTPTARCWDSGAVVANGSDAPIEELDPLAGIRAGVRRTIDERDGVASRAGADGRSRRSRRRASRRRGSRGDERRRGTAAPRLRAPTSSCSTATRGTTSTRRSSRRWSAAAGCTTRRPGTDAAPMAAGERVFRAAA